MTELNQLSEEAQKLADELTDVQLQFAWHVISGKSQAEAYRLTHEGCADSTAMGHGSRMANNGKVAAFIRCVRQEDWKGEFVGYYEQRAMLAAILRDETRQQDHSWAMALNARIGGFLDGPPERKEDKERSAFEELAAAIRPTLGLPNNGGQEWQLSP